MTGQTFRVVKSGCVLQLPVRIVTRKTTDPRIVCVMTAAVKHSIRLKTNIVNPSLPRHDHHLIEAAMAGPTEFLRKRLWVHSAWIEDLQFLRAGISGREVSFSRPVTAFAGNAWRQAIQLQRRSRDRAWSMASDAVPRLILTQRTPQRLGWRGWKLMWLANSEIEVSKRLIVADPALIKHFAAPKEVGLAHPRSEAIEQGLGNPVLTIADGVNASTALARNLIGIGAVAKAQSGLLCQNLTIGDRLERMGHRSVQLS